MEDVYEDDECVHIVMELCHGGELWHRIGDRHYSERTVGGWVGGLRRPGPRATSGAVHGRWAGGQRGWGGARGQGLGQAAGVKVLGAGAVCMRSVVLAGAGEERGTRVG